jgi:opacity protein-like surface antigen
MGSSAWKARLTAVALAAAVAAVMAATAVAGVTVYTNNFSSRSEAKELRHSEGKHCNKDWRKKAKSVLVTASKGRTVCGYSPPVQGDGAAPNHRFEATEKLLKDTPKSVRDGVYLGIAVRSAKDTGYQLQVFPSEHKFKLTRQTGGDKVGVLAKGSNKAIDGTNKPNAMLLSAVGSQVIAKVNGKRLAKVGDRASGQVDGRKVEVLLGYKKKRSKPASATFGNLELQVPRP